LRLSRDPISIFLINRKAATEKIRKRKGENINRGEKIGTVGSTGRSTGAHLDWRINWLDKRLDPELIANIKE